jgi:hypothetical protein
MKEMYKGFEIEVCQDQYRNDNPRDWSNLGIIAIVYNRYFEGDETVTQETVNDILNDPDLISLPVYAHIHSNISLSTSDFSDRFDSGMAGVIYVSKHTAKKEFGDIFSEEIILSNLKSEVNTYSTWLSDGVLGYTIKLNGDVIDSCWGFYDTVESVLAQAKEAADGIDNNQCVFNTPDNNSGVGNEGCKNG